MFTTKLSTPCQGGMMIVRGNNITSVLGVSTGFVKKQLWVSYKEKLEVSALH
jgi:hypothetical protein